MWVNLRVPMSHDLFSTRDNVNMGQCMYIISIVYS